MDRSNITYDNHFSILSWIYRQEATTSRNIVLLAENLRSNSYYFIWDAEFTSVFFNRKLWKIR